MKQCKLGQNGPTVSAVGYGAMSFTDFYGPADDAESARVLDACVDMGITHVDTANVYGMGRSETVIGNWLRARKGECPFTIATKVGITRMRGEWHDYNGCWLPDGEGNPAKTPLPSCVIFPIFPWTIS